MPQANDCNYLIFNCILLHVLTAWNASRKYQSNPRGPQPQVDHTRQDRRSKFRENELSFYFALRRAWPVFLMSLMVGLPAATVQAATTAERCRQQYATSTQAQLQCVRQVIDQRQSAPAPGGAWAKPLSVAPPTPAPAPLPGVVPPMGNLNVIFGFYDRRFPGFNGGQEHLGVDFTAAAGAPVLAICDGTVVSTNTDYADTPSAYVVVDHRCPEPLGNVYAYYGHIHSDALRGDVVPAGATIGTVRDWPGNGHLHLGLSRRLVEENWGTYPRGVTQQDLEEQGWLNPLDYFAATPRAVAAPVRPAAVRRAPAAASKRVTPQAPVYRQNRPGNVAGQRRR